MRIIAGNFKGRQIKSPKGLNTRPTTAQLREALFNILGSSIEEADILDLFSGSGIITFEALSRGAATSLAIDASTAAVAAFKENKSLLQVDKQVRIVKKDVAKFLQKAEANSFDLIYADPPYNLGWGEKVAKEVYEKKLLRKRGVLVIEEGTPIEEHSFASYEVRQYGRSTLHFLRP